jgi:hypothetical protein
VTGVPRPSSHGRGDRADRPRARSKPVLAGAPSRHRLATTTTAPARSQPAAGHSEVLRLAIQASTRRPPASSTANGTSSGGSLTRNSGRCQTRCRAESIAAIAALIVAIVFRPHERATSARGSIQPAGQREVARSAGPWSSPTTPAQPGAPDRQERVVAVLQDRQGEPPPTQLLAEGSADQDHQRPDHHDFRSEAGPGALCGPLVSREAAMAARRDTPAPQRRCAPVPVGVPAQGCLRRTAPAGGTPGRCRGDVLGA